MHMRCLWITSDLACIRGRDGNVRVWEPTISEAPLKAAGKKAMSGERGR